MFPGQLCLLSDSGACVLHTAAQHLMPDPEPEPGTASSGATAGGAVAALKAPASAPASAAAAAHESESEGEDIQDTDDETDSESEAESAEPGAGLECTICCEGEDAGELLHMGCGCRGSAARAHGSCMVLAARHNNNSWTDCPTCRQVFTGKASLLLAQTYWGEELWTLKEDEDADRASAATHLAMATLELVIAPLEGHELSPEQAESTKAKCLALFEDALLAQRRSCARTTVGSAMHARASALVAMRLANLGAYHFNMGDHPTALPYLEDAAAEQQVWEGEVDDATVRTMHNLASCYALVGRRDEATAIYETLTKLQLSEECATKIAITGDFGAHLLDTGQRDKGLALMEASRTQATRLLGSTHPLTRERTRLLSEACALVDAHPRGRTDDVTVAPKVPAAPNFAPVAGSVRGRIISDNPDLDGSQIHVLKYKPSKGRYIILLHPERGDEAQKSLCKPTSLVLGSGTLAIVSNLQTMPELNGRRGVVERFDGAQSHYVVRLEGRAKPVSLNPGNCLALVPGATPRSHQAI